MAGHNCDDLATNIVFCGSVKKGHEAVAAGEISSVAGRATGVGEDEGNRALEEVN